MRPLEVSKDILPIARFKAHASEIIHRVKNEGRPTVITLNGEPAAVLVHPADYDKYFRDVAFRQVVDRGLEDVKARRTVSDAEFKDWAKKQFGAFRKKRR
jgi:prevent-host-death family protein